jgi:hypothetical protein
MRASYSRYYRRMLPDLLNALAFRSNNSRHRPVLTALAGIERMLNDGRRHLHAEEDMPIDGVIPAKWRDLVLEKDRTGTERINRINYEICVLHALRERLRCKVIWVVGSDRYRNPDEDLPADFEERRGTYYGELNLATDPAGFIAGLKTEMTDALKKLESELPHNRSVRLLHRGKNRCRLPAIDETEAIPCG